MFLHTKLHGKKFYFALNTHPEISSWSIKFISILVIRYYEYLITSIFYILAKKEESSDEESSDEEEAPAKPVAPVANGKPAATNGKKEESSDESSDDSDDEVEAKTKQIPTGNYQFEI